MGLDSVELVMDVEKTFGIEIPDQVAQNIVTVGDFHEAVWERIKEKESNRCKSAMLFYRFRSFFEKKYGISRKGFNTATDLNRVVPGKQRKTEWKSIEQDLGYKLPKLVLPASLSYFLTWFGLITILGGLLAAFLAVEFWNASKWYWLIPLAGLALTILLAYAFDPFRVIIEPKNVRGFTEQVLMLNYRKIAENSGTNRQKMERVMALIIQDKSGQDLSGIRPEVKIREDLGID